MSGKRGALVGHWFRTGAVVKPLVSYQGWMLIPTGGEIPPPIGGGPKSQFFGGATPKLSCVQHRFPGASLAPCCSLNSVTYLLLLVLFF